MRWLSTRMRGGGRGTAPPPGALLLSSTPVERGLEGGGGGGGGGLPHAQSSLPKDMSSSFFFPPLSSPPSQSLAGLPLLSVASSLSLLQSSSSLAAYSSLPLCSSSSSSRSSREDSLCPSSVPRRYPHTRAFLLHPSSTLGTSRTLNERQPPSPLLARSASPSSSSACCQTGLLSLQSPGSCFCPRGRCHSPSPPLSPSLSSSFPRASSLPRSFCRSLSRRSHLEAVTGHKQRPPQAQTRAPRTAAYRRACFLLSSSQHVQRSWRTRASTSRTHSTALSRSLLDVLSRPPPSSLTSSQAESSRPGSSSSLAPSDLSPAPPLSLVSSKPSSYASALHLSSPRQRLTMPSALTGRSEQASTLRKISRAYLHQGVGCLDSSYSPSTISSRTVGSRQRPAREAPRSSGFGPAKRPEKAAATPHSLLAPGSLPAVLVLPPSTTKAHKFPCSLLRCRHSYPSRYCSFSGLQANPQEVPRTERSLATSDAKAAIRTNIVSDSTSAEKHEGKDIPVQPVFSCGDRERLKQEDDDEERLAKKRGKKGKSTHPTRSQIEGANRCRVLQLAQMAVDAITDKGGLDRSSFRKPLFFGEKNFSLSPARNALGGEQNVERCPMGKEAEALELPEPRRQHYLPDERERDVGEEGGGEDGDSRKNDEAPVCASPGKGRRGPAPDQLLGSGGEESLEESLGALREEQQSLVRLEEASRETLSLKQFFQEVGQALKTHERKMMLKSSGREVRNALKGLLRAERYLEERSQDGMKNLEVVSEDRREGRRLEEREKKEGEHPVRSPESVSQSPQQFLSSLLSTTTSTSAPTAAVSSASSSGVSLSSSSTSSSEVACTAAAFSASSPVSALSSSVLPGSRSPPSSQSGGPGGCPFPLRLSSSGFFPIGEPLAFVFTADLRLYRCWLSCVAHRWKRDLHAWLDRQDDLRRGESQPPESTEYERFLAFFMPHVKRLISQALEVAVHYEVSAMQRVVASSKDRPALGENLGGDSATLSFSSSCAGRPESEELRERQTVQEEARRRVWILTVSLLEEVAVIVKLLKEMAQRRVLLHFAPLVLHAIHVEIQARHGLLEASTAPPLAPQSDSVETAGAAAFRAFLASPAGRRYHGNSQHSSPPRRRIVEGSSPSAAACEKKGQLTSSKGEVASVDPERTPTRCADVNTGSSCGKPKDRESMASAVPLDPRGGPFNNKESPRRDGVRALAEKPSSFSRPTAAQWSGHLHVTILRAFGRMGLYSEKLLHSVSDQSKSLWPEDLVFFLFECGRYGLAVQHLIDRHAVEAAGVLDKISDPLLYLTTAALHRSSASHRLFFDAALPRLGAAITTYEDPAFLRTMLSICRALDPHCELPPYTRLAAQAAIAMRRFVPYLDVNTLALLLGIVDNRSARTPQEYCDLARASCKRIEELQRIYERRRLTSRLKSGGDAEPEANAPRHDAVPQGGSWGGKQTAPAALSGGSSSSFLSRSKRDGAAEHTLPNVFETLSSALALGDVVFGLSSFGIATPLYPLLEDMAVQRLEGILFSKKEALWFLVWAAFAAAPGFTPRRLTLALREKMLEDGSSEVQNCFTSISHTVQKLGAFHVQRLLLPLQLMGVYDADIIRLCLDTSLDRDRSSFKRVDAALSLAFPLAFVNVLPTEHMEELLSVWQVNCSKIFVIGNAFRGEFARACMIAVLWAAALKNLHTRQTSVVQHLDKLFACLDSPPSLYAWQQFSKPRLSSSGAPHVSHYSNKMDEYTRDPASAPSLLFSTLPHTRSMQGPAQGGLSCSSQPPMKDWHSLSDLRQHDRMAVLQMKQPLQLVHQLAATYLADMPHAVRRCIKYPLIRAWANAAADPSVDEDPSVYRIVEELQAILFQNGIRSRAFVPTAPAVRCSKSVAGDARETVASWLGGEPSPSNSYPDSYPLTTATPECIHLHLLDATKESKVCSGTSASVSRKCGVLVLGERDGLATLPEWETTYFDTGINAMRLRCLRLKGWEPITINMYEWRETKTDAAKLGLFLDKCDRADVSLPFCVE